MLLTLIQGMLIQQPSQKVHNRQTYKRNSILIKKRADSRSDNIATRG